MSTHAIKDVRQGEALTAWSSSASEGAGVCRGTIAGVTGFGKTKVAIEAIMKFERTGELKAWLDTYNTKPVTLAVPTEELRDVTWAEEILKFYGAEGLRLFKLYVHAVCYASLDEMKGNSLLLILDECHRITANNSKNFNVTFFCNHILALTATVPDVERDATKASILDNIAPIRYTYTYADALTDGLISDFEVTVVSVPLDVSRKYLEAGRKDNKFFTTENAAYSYADKRLSKAYMMPPSKAKAGAVKFATLNRMHLIHSLESKVIAATKLLKAIHVPNKSLKTLVFDQSIERLGKLLPSEFCYHSKSKNRDAIKHFSNNKTRILGAVQALNEGVNVGKVDLELIMGMNSNSRDTVQRIGRSIRYYEGHKTHIIILQSLGTQDVNWVAEALKEIPPELISYKSVDQVLADYK